MLNHPKLKLQINESTSSYQLFSPKSKVISRRGSITSSEPKQTKTFIFCNDKLRTALKEQENLYKFMGQMNTTLDLHLELRAPKVQRNFIILRNIIKDTLTQLDLQRKKIERLEKEYTSSESYLALTAEINHFQSILNKFSSLAEDASSKIDFHRNSMTNSQERLKAHKDSLKAKVHENLTLTALIIQTKRLIALRRFEKASEPTSNASSPMKRSNSVQPIHPFKLKLSKKELQLQAITKLDKTDQIVSASKLINSTPVSTHRILAELNKGFRSTKNSKGQGNYVQQPILARRQQGTLITQLGVSTPGKVSTSRFISHRSVSEDPTINSSMEWRNQKELKQAIKENNKTRQELIQKCSQYVMLAQLFNDCCHNYQDYLLKSQQSSSLKGLHGTLLFVLLQAKKQEPISEYGPTMDTIRNFHRQSVRSFRRRSEGENTDIAAKVFERAKKAEKLKQDNNRAMISHLSNEDIENFSPLQLFGLLLIRKEAERSFRELFTQKLKLISNLFRLVKEIRLEN